MASRAAAYSDDEVVLSSVHLGAKEEPSIGQVISEWRINITGFFCACYTNIAFFYEVKIASSHQILNTLLTHFCYVIPSETFEQDAVKANEDGDLDVPRKSSSGCRLHTAVIGTLQKKPNVPNTAKRKNEIINVNSQLRKMLFIRQLAMAIYVYI